MTDKIKNNNNIILTENYQTIREDEKTCKVFNTYFTYVTKSIKLREVDKTQSFKNKGSCRLIKMHFENGSFSFKQASKNVTEILLCSDASSDDTNNTLIMNEFHHGIPYRF